MKKEELKKDPIQDKIVELIKTIGNNKSTIFIGILCFGIIISVVNYFQYNNKMNNEKASFVLSKAQNELNSGNDSLGLIQLNKLLNEYESTDFSDMSKIYFIKQSQSDDIDINYYLDNVNKVQDPYMKSFLYSVKGDLDMDMENYVSAIGHYQKAYDLIDNPHYCDKLSSALIKSKEYNKVISIIEDVLKKDKLYGLKRKFEEYLALAQAMKNKSL